jgi:hypothetical protein
MRVRTGFVSNSSTSSFCVLGTWDEATIEALLRAEGVWDKDKDGDLLDQGLWTGRVVTFVGWDEGATFAGTWVGDDVLEEKSLTQIRQEFVAEVKNELGVDIDVNVNLKLEYGECGSG